MISVIDHEILLRAGAFIVVLGVMAVWEWRAPCRVLTVAKWLRWRSNLALVVLNTVILRLLFPAAAVGMAHFAERHGWGVLNYLHLSPWLAALLAVIALDFAIWLQHVMVHAIPLLWRLHRVHHADLDFDLTTGVRFHPLEIVLSMLVKFAAIVLIGPPVAAVIVFEVLLNATAMFNHGNVSLPGWLERPLRTLLVTPDMHRIHHSVEDDETNSNFGFNLSCWDRLFGTYRARSRAGQQRMTIGIRGFRSPQEVCGLAGMLALPFRHQQDSYVINRRVWTAGKGVDG
jgi:sterol desaturase/sphingolipid hydroxylase (fatty acid hydroxylase superfamily)